VAKVHQKYFTETKNVEWYHLEIKLICEKRPCFCQIKKGSCYCQQQADTALPFCLSSMLVLLWKT